MGDCKIEPEEEKASPPASASILPVQVSLQRILMVHSGWSALVLALDGSLPLFIGVYVYYE